MWEVGRRKLYMSGTIVLHAVLKGGVSQATALAVKGVEEYVLIVMLVTTEER